MKPISEKNAMKWINALRSGKYSQAIHALQSTSTNGYCCLGVACDIFIPKNKRRIDYDTGTLRGGYPSHQPNAPEWLKNANLNFMKIAGSDDTMTLSKLNDTGEYNFDEIADILQLIFVEKALA